MRINLRLLVRAGISSFSEAKGTAGCLLETIHEPCKERTTKVSVVGTGSVGMACAASIMIRGVCANIALLDGQKEKMQAEYLDLLHGSPFVGDPRLSADTDPKVTANSTVVIVTAGLRQKEGQSRLELLQDNVNLFKKLIPSLVEQSPDAIFIIVTNPVDIMTSVATKLSCLPVNRVMGSATELDTARFRVLISQRLGVSPTSCRGWIIGEHGNSSVPVWSGVNVCGVRLKELHPQLGCPDDPENWKKVHQRVVDSAGKIIKGKGYTNWGVGLTVSQLTRAIIKNSKTIHGVSTFAKCHHGIEHDVYLSLPCVLGAGGVEKIVNLTLSEEETKLVQASAKILHDVQKDIKL